MSDNNNTNLDDENIPRKRSPNRLMVDEAEKDDNSIVCMSPAKFEELQLFKGDAVTIKVYFNLNFFINREKEEKVQSVLHYLMKHVMMQKLK